jgi:hypothetical protein
MNLSLYDSAGPGRDRQAMKMCLREGPLEMDCPRTKGNITPLIQIAIIFCGFQQGKNAEYFERVKMGKLVNLEMAWGGRGSCRAAI